jgi:hypothetical protein
MSPERQEHHHGLNGQFALNGEDGIMPICGHMQPVYKNKRNPKGDDCPDEQPLAIATTPRTGLRWLSCVWPVGVGGDVVTLRLLINSRAGFVRQDRLLLEDEYDSRTWEAPSRRSGGLLHQLMTDFAQNVDRGRELFRDQHIIGVVGGDGENGNVTGR